MASSSARSARMAATSPGGWFRSGAPPNRHYTARTPSCRARFTNRREDRLHLTPCEQEKLLVFVAAELARKRQKRGLKLNYPEAMAVLSAEILEAARDGKS